MVEENLLTRAQIQEEGENTRVCRKVLPGRKREIFNREVEMLRWFGRNKHAHLIQVLATISYGEDEHCLLFPWADGDLVTYFQTHETAPREDSFLKWVSAQIYGLADAVRYIHDPKCLNDKGEELFGRHGDIKPENILWFRNRGDPKYGSLVLSDLGITAINRLGTRSYLPHEKVFGWSPGYEPPELHIAGDDGKISRSYDIWSLGCVFLEFLVWYLGGWKGGFKQLLLDRMEEPSPNNIGSDNFYGVSWMEDGKYVFGIKNTISKVHSTFCHLMVFCDANLY
jgi:serine/threonine protein kinase